LLWSCQEEISGNPDPHLLAETEKVKLVRSTVKDVLASKVAKNIAASMGDSEVLFFMTKKADEQFDDDFNFLIEAAKGRIRSHLLLT
jgi:hypothetical protein